MEESLNGMKKTCEMKFKIVSRVPKRLKSYCSHPEVDSTLIHANNRARLYVDRELNDLRLEMVKLNRTSTSAAVDASQLSRINMQLFTVRIWLQSSDPSSADHLQVATPFILSLQYFGAENKIFSFDRSSRTFLYSVVILLFSLPVLILSLNSINKYWDTYGRDRLHRTLGLERKKTSEKYVNV